MSWRPLRSCSAFSGYGNLLLVSHVLEIPVHKFEDVLLQHVLNTQNSWALLPWQSVLCHCVLGKDLFHTEVKSSRCKCWCMVCPYKYYNLLATRDFHVLLEEVTKAGFVPGGTVDRDFFVQTFSFRSSTVCVFIYLFTVRGESRRDFQTTCCIYIQWHGSQTITYQLTIKF